MEVHSDFRDLLELLNEHEVEYLVVGAYALGFHGAPRYTRDLDVLVKPGGENARRVLEAVADFGFTSHGLTEADFDRPDRVIQFGFPPVRIDLVTSISGVSWDEAWDSREQGQMADVPVSFLGRDAFITNKRASGRLKDLADVEALGEKP
jgi:hypothetical protein